MKNSINKQCYKVLSIIVTVSLLLGLMPNSLIKVSAATSYSSWSSVASAATNGIDEDYYLDADGNLSIYTELGLAWFASSVNGGNSYSEKTVTLYNNLDLTSVGVTNYSGTGNTMTGSVSWTPIGRSGAPFKGEFDGGGYSISGVYISGSSTNIGLFGYASYATISNVNVINSQIRGSYSVGGIAGEVTYTTISNCSNSGTIYASSERAGGITGKNATGCVIQNCFNTGSITAASGYVGGITGTSDNSSITLCYNTGAISTNNKFVGGITGNNYNSTISNCFSTGTVEGATSIGGISGGYGTSIENCYYDGFAYSGSAAYNVANTDTVTSLTSIEMTSSEFLEKLNGTSDGVWGLKTDDSGNSYYPYLTSFGEESANFAYVTCDTWQDVAAVAVANTDYTYVDASTLYIHTAYGLAWFANEVNSGNSFSGYTVALTDDIDLLSACLTDYNESTIMADDYSGSNNWTPIGSEEYPFEGIFKGTGDADAHTISNMYINTTDDYQGLFGYVDDATITKVAVVDSSISGDDFVGSIVGCATGTTNITSCYNTSEVSGVDNVGGVIGGYNDTDSFTLSSCYNTGDIDGANYVGGIIGSINSNDATLSESYNIGSVVGTDYVGGVLGEYDTTTNCVITSCYYNGDTTTNVNSIYGTGLTTSQMTGNNASANMDFSDTWYFYGETTSGLTTYYYYPFLLSNTQTPIPYVSYTPSFDEVFEGEGSEESPYLISSLEDIGYLATYTNGGLKTEGVYFEQTQDIELTSDYTAIGSYYNYFAGYYNGNGYKLSGSLSGSNLAVFKYTATTAVISNINATMSITGSESIASVVVYNYGTVENCTSSSDFISNGELIGVGGIVARNYGRVTGCYFSGTISIDSGFSDSIAGIAYSNSGTITNCYNTGTIKGSSYIGGIVSYNSGTVSSCYNTGSITGTSNVGAVVVRNDTDGTVTNCYYLENNNTGVVISEGETSNVVALSESEITGIGTERSSEVMVGFDSDIWTFISDEEDSYSPILTNNPELLVVVFNDEGTQYTSTLNEDGTVTKPSNPTKLGYTFNGWYEEDAKSAFDFNTEITEVITLTASYTDIIAPVIEGVEHLQFYQDDLTITVTDNDVLDTITLNGETVEDTFTITVTKDATYELIATDKDGNSTVVKFYTYVEEVSVDIVLDDLPTVDENTTEEEKEEIKEIIANLIDELMITLDKDTAKDDEELLETLQSLEDVYLSVNDNITVVENTPVIDKDIPEKDRVVITDVIPEGLALAVSKSIESDGQDIELSLSIKQCVSDGDYLVFNIKPLITIDGETEVIDNDDIQSPVSFKLYLNDTFKGSFATVEHIKQDGSSDYYTCPVLSDEIGKYIVLTVSQFSNFIVGEISYDVTVDGITTSYKATDTIILDIPTKEGYAFAGWTSDEVEIVDNQFTMPDKDVTITSTWEIEYADYSAVDDALAKADALDSSLYTNYADVQTAIDAIVTGLDITKQEIVDAYAKAIELAIEGLILIDSDVVAPDADTDTELELDDNTDSEVESDEETEDVVDSSDSNHMFTYSTLLFSSLAYILLENKRRIKE